MCRFTHNSYLMNVSLSSYLLEVLVGAKPLSGNLELSSSEGSCFTKATTHHQEQLHPMANQGYKGSVFIERITLKNHPNSWASCGIIWDLYCSSNVVNHFLCSVSPPSIGFLERTPQLSYPKPYFRSFVSPTPSIGSFALLSLCSHYSLPVPHDF